uniref:MFS transporter n=1 Tax=Pseudonocardia pini TaxID=2758030 RepID=UPI001C687416
VDTVDTVDTGGLRAAVDSVRAHPDSLVLVGVAVLVFAFTLNFQVVLTLMATGAYGLSADGLGLLATAMAAGSICGALLSARRRTVPRSLVLGAATAVGTLWLVGAVVPVVYGFAAALFATGLVTITFATSSNARLQLVTPPRMQGRVMAMYLAACSLGAPLTAPVIGWISDTAGPRWAMVTGGCWILLAAGLGAVVLAFRRRAGAPVASPTPPVPDSERSSP